MTRTGITLCRGCCCGTERKRPVVDHERQRSQLQELVDAGHASLRESGCLGLCGKANIVVVRPSRFARTRGVPPVWLGGIDDDALPLITAWIGDGGPGRAPLPDALRCRVVAPPQRPTSTPVQLDIRRRRHWL
jgi:(2Fe-2S) ferredoxin